jgi:hypothetical protein
LFPNSLLPSETHAPKTTVADTASIKAPEGEGCPRCGGAVFAAEMMLSKGREWHKKCFKCNDCKKTLDSIIACDGPDKDVYCRTCYGKKWGPHGYGFACGSGFLQTDGQRLFLLWKMNANAHKFHLSSQAPLQSSLPMVQVAQDVVEQFLQLNNNLQKAQCGIKNASTATNVKSLNLLRFIL